MIPALVPPEKFLEIAAALICLATVSLTGERANVAIRMMPSKMRVRSKFLKNNYLN